MAWRGTDPWRSGWVTALVGIVLATLFAAHATGHSPIGALTRLDGWWHDTRALLLAPREPDPRVAVVAIDERSLAELGRWPWNRARLAELIEAIVDREGAAVLGVDVLFTEADRSSGVAELDALAQGPLRDDAQFTRYWQAHRAEIDTDGRLARALQGRPVLLGYYLSAERGALRTGQLPPAIQPEPPGLRGLPVFEGYYAALPELQAAAAGGGFVNAFVAPDGVRRESPLLARQGDALLSALSLTMLQQHLQAGPLRTARVRSGEVDVATALHVVGPTEQRMLPLGKGAEVLVPYPARDALPATHSAVDVLRGTLPANALRGKLVLLGATAPGLADLHATPVWEHMPGVYSHTALLSGMLDQRLPHRPSWAPLAELAMIAAVLGAFFLGLRSALSSMTSMALGTILGLIAANLMSYSLFEWGLPIAGPMALGLALFGWQLFTGNLYESNSRRRLARLFEQYVPPELVDRMSRDPGAYGMEGRSAVLTVLFADIQGFTALSETMEPAQLSALMNETFSELTDIVRHHRGTLDKYMGDALMAFWGAPVADEQHALHAVEAALAMQEALPALNARFALRGWPQLSLSVGINSGTMVVGDLGSRHRRAYTVLGDAVNVASRLERACQSLGADIVIGEATRDAIGLWPCRELPTLSVRGRRAPVRVFEPLPLRALIDGGATARERARLEAAAAQQPALAARPHQENPKPQH